MRWLGFVLFFVLAASCPAQFRTVEMTFQGVGCASCLESLPSRVQRLRGVESATVDAKAGVLTVKLAEQNRVRVEQIRDFVEQDGNGHLHFPRGRGQQFGHAVVEVEEFGGLEEAGLGGEPRVEFALEGFVARG